MDDAAPDRETRAAELRAVLDDPEALAVVHQPLVSLATGGVRGFEALARFLSPVRRPPDAWFALAHELGRGPELEARALAAALAAARPAGTHLSVNASPSALLSPEVAAVLPARLDGVVVEVTEHELVADFAELAAVLADLRARGARVAVDDAGAGYAGLTQVVRLEPDLIKLDRALTRGVDADLAKQALVEAFVRFAERVGAQLCAEGIETETELRTLADLDVALGQGYVLARPAPGWPQPAPEAVAVCRGAMRAALSSGGAPSTAAAPRFGELNARLAAASTCSEVRTAVAGLADGLRAQRVAVRLRSDEEGPGALATVPRVRLAVERRRAVQVLADDPEADPAARAVLVALGFAAALVVPVVARGRLLGVVEVLRATSDGWTRAQLARASAVANHAGAALDAVLSASAAPLAASGLRG